MPVVMISLRRSKHLRRSTVEAIGGFRLRIAIPLAQICLISRLYQ
jgi:hypothetical protein